MPPGTATSVGLVRQEPGARSKRPAATNSRDRHESTTLRLSARDVMLQAGRLGHQQEARVPAVPPRRPAAAHEDQAAQAHQPAARPCGAGQGANQHWSMDFVHDQMLDGRKFRILTVIDQWSRESVSLEPGFSLTGQVRRPGAGPGREPARLAAGDHRRQRHRVHLQGARRMGLPARRQARLHAAWKAHRQRADRVIQRSAARRVPEHPRVRHDARRARELKAWKDDYNNRRPHGSLGHLTPSEFANRGQNNPGSGQPLVQTVGETGPTLLYCPSVTSKARFFGEGPNDAHGTTDRCATPRLDQSHTPSGKMRMRRSHSALLKFIR